MLNCDYMPDAVEDAGDTIEKGGTQYSSYIIMEFVM